MSDKVDTGGKRLNLFPAKKQKKKLSVDDKAFNTMEAVADKTNVDIFAEGKKSSTKGIHTALLAAGMTPAYGNVADVADATLYALEGEFGEAAWSMAAAIPIVGQMVSGRRAVKVAKEAGEEMVTLYRGIPEWYPGKMVNEGKFVSPQGLKYYDIDLPQPSSKGIFVTDNMKGAVEYRNVHEYHNLGKYNPQTGKLKKPSVLEFEVPKSWWNRNKNQKSLQRYYDETGVEGELGEYWIEGGIPKEFLKKVHK